MEISLRPDLEKLINEKVQSGLYRTPDEVLNEALNLLKERDQAEHRLETLLQEAEDSGPATEMTPQDWTDIEQEGLRRLNTRKSA
jgi:antitoxin ParD1/3/4